LPPFFEEKLVSKKLVCFKKHFNLGDSWSDMDREEFIKKAKVALAAA